MTNLEKYTLAFVEGLSINKSLVTPDLKYQDIAEWDSVGHMALIAELEDKFNIMLETDDIIDFNSYEKGKEILAKYNVQF